MREKRRWVLFLVSPVLFQFGCGSVSQDVGADGGEGGGVDAMVDPCGTNACECMVDDDCDEFAVCDTTSTPGRICVCVPTYADSKGNGCEFVGAPADPGFQQADVWAGTSAIRDTINVDAAGDIDIGVGVIDGDGACLLDSFSQTFTMPSRDRSESLAVDVSYRSMATGFRRIGAAVEINGGWHHLPIHEQFANESFCLGDGGYGGPIEFKVSPTTTPSGCSESLQIDRFAIRKATAADECPSVGAAINGDMEDDGGWTFSQGGSGVASLVPGVGSGSSRGLRLTTTTRCSQATATTQISLPTDATLANSAIEFFSAGNPSSYAEISLAGVPISRLAPNGMRRVCVPDWAKGTVQDLSVALRSGHVSTCSVARNRMVIIDSVSVTSDPACGDPNSGNGFETLATASGVAPSWALFDGSVNGIVSPSRIVNTTSNARSGNGSLRLAVTSHCSGAKARRDIIVPPANGNAGPAIKAFFNVSAAPVGSAKLSHQEGQVSAKRVAGYQSLTLCLPPKYIGRPLSIGVSARGDYAGCNAMPASVTYVDDVEITTDASCPVE